MPFGNIEVLKPTRAHLESVMEILNDGDAAIPREIAVKSGLTQNQVNCALNHLELHGVVLCLQQKIAPVKRAQINDLTKYKNALKSARY